MQQLVMSTQDRVADHLHPTKVRNKKGQSRQVASEGMKLHTLAMLILTHLQVRCTQSLTPTALAFQTKICNPCTCRSGACRAACTCARVSAARLWSTSPWLPQHRASEAAVAAAQLPAPKPPKTIDRSKSLFDGQVVDGSDHHVIVFLPLNALAATQLPAPKPP
eukprot:1158351-Pelagomonas_calceolata.AAC.5